MVHSIMDTASLFARRMCVLMLPFCFLASIISFPDNVLAARYTAVRSFDGADYKNAAAAAARAAARNQAMQDQMRHLAARPEVRFAAKVETQRRLNPDPLALAYAVTSLHLTASVFREQRDGSGTVSVSAQTAPHTDSAAVRTALLNTERLQLYQTAVLHEQQLVDTFDKYSDTAKIKTKKNLPAIEIIRKQLIAIDIYLETLPQLTNGTWLHPSDVLTRMQTALNLAPENPLLLSALGDACLLLSRPHEAQEAQTKALKIAPEMPRAYHGRGVAYLALRLPSLALTDLNEAIRLAPSSSSYRRDRAAAWLLLENIDNMCTDLYEACALGDCAHYKWAIDQGSCGKNPVTSKNNTH